MRSLPNIMKAKKKPLDEKAPSDYGVDCRGQAQGPEDREPAGRQAGVKVKDVAELVEKLRTKPACFRR